MGSHVDAPRVVRTELPSLDIGIMLQFSFPLLFSQNNESLFSFSNICGHFVKCQPMVAGLTGNGREQGNLDS